LTHTVHLPKAIDTLRLGRKSRYGSCVGGM